MGMLDVMAKLAQEASSENYSCKAIIGTLAAGYVPLAGFIVYLVKELIARNKLADTLLRVADEELEKRSRKGGRP